MSFTYQDNNNVILHLLEIITYPLTNEGAVEFKKYFLFDKCIKNWIVFRVLRKMSKIDWGHFYFSLTIF